jgi:TP901 family phage tail tape measure protein
MARSGAAASAAASNMQNNLINTINQTGKFSASIKTIASTTEAFTTSLEKNKLSMGQYFKFAGGASKTFGKFFKTEMDTIDKVARERVKTLQTQYIKLGRDASGALKSIAIRPLALDMEDLGTKTAIAAQKQQLMNQLLKQGSTNLLNFGKNTQWAGRQLMVGFTIPLAMVGTAAAKTFMKMEEQAIKFKRVYGDSMTPTAEADLMVKQIRDLATEFTKYGVAAEKTMELAATAAAAGKQGLELTAQVREANRLAVLGQVEQQDALSTTISITNAFGIAADQLAKKIDFLNAVENQTVTSIEDLTIAVPKAGPVVKQLGGDVEDLAFFLTAMKEGGINASEGANALKSGLAALINPTGKAADMLASFGINVKGIVEANKGDVKGLVVDFAKALDTLDPLSRARAIEQLFGKFQFSRLSTLFQNVIAEGTQASRVLELTGRSAADLAALSSKELGTVAASSMFKFQKAVEELKMALAPIGEIFLKLITPLLEFGSKVLENFNKLDAGAKNFIVGLIGVVGGLGPVLIMTFGLLANGIANIIKGFMLVRNIFTKSGQSSKYLGDQTDYMTQQQLEATSVAASLEQVHQRLEQRFTSEAIAVDKLTQALQRANNANLVYQGAGARVTPPAKRFAVGGFVSGPGTGTSDSIPAMLSNGEAVIPAKSVKKNRGLVEGLIAGNIPGFFKGGVIGGPHFLGMPRTAKQVTAGRENAEMVYQEFLKSGRFRNQQPENYVGQIQKSGGHSFPIFGLGGIYHKADGSNVFVKPVMNEVAALAELRGTIIAREAHGLIAPQQRIVVMRDPSDRTGTRRFLALESKVDPKLSTPTGKFSADQYFQQLLAASLRGDKDLSGDNIFENFLPDVGPAGVFNRASGLRDYEKNMPSVEQQATINLLGVKGGAKKAFAQSTADLIRSMTPEQYAEGMRKEVARVLPRLRQTIASLDLNDVERPFYADMITRLETAQGIDWRKFHYMHSMVQAPKPSQASSKVLKLANGIVSVPGPKGAGDVVPAMLSPGEAVVPAKQSKKYAGLIQGIVADNIPGYNKGNIKVKSSTSGSQATSPVMIDFGGGAISVKASQQQKIAETLGDTVNLAMSTLGIDIQPKLLQVLSQEENLTIDRLEEIFKGFSGNLVNHVRRYTEVGIIQLAHGTPPVDVKPELANKLGNFFSQDNPNAVHRTMANETKTRKYHTEQVFGMPMASNQQDLLMSGTENADFVRKFPEVVMKRLAEFGDLDPNDPGLRDFAMKMADRLEAAGTKAITESNFYEIVSATLGDEIDKTAREVIERAGNTVRTGQFKVEGSSRTRRNVIGQKAKKSGRGAAPQAYVDEETGLTFGGGQAFTQGRDTVREFDVAVAESEKKRLREKARLAGIVLVEQVPFGVEQGLNESIDRNSPPKKAIQIGRDYGLALNAALRESIPKIRVAGEAFGVAATTGMTTVSPAMMQHLRETGGRILRPYIDAQSTMVPIAKQKISVLDKEVIATKRATDAQVLNNIAMNGAAAAALNASMRVQGLGFSLLTAGGVGLIPGMGMGGNTGQNEDPDPDSEGKSRSKFERISSGIRSTTFALTSLAGAATMAGGPIGEAAGSIMAFSGIAYALITVMDLLSMAATNSKNAMLAQIGSFLMFSKGRASGVGFLATMKNAFLPISLAFTKAGGGIKGFLGGLRAVGPALLAMGRGLFSFIPVIGWIVGGITALVLIVNAVNEAKEKERLAIEGVADATKTTTEELNSLADELGKEKIVTAFDRIAQGADPTASSATVSLTQRLKESDTFAENFKKDIDAIRGMSQRELKTYQETLGLRLQATGQYSKEEVASIVKAIQQEAERTDVAFAFNSIDLTSKNGKNFKTSISRMAQVLKGVTDKTDTQSLSIFNSTSMALSETINSLTTALQQGVIGTDAYTLRMQVLKDEVLALPNAAQVAAEMMTNFTAVLNATRPDMATLLLGVKGAKEQLFLMGAVANGAIPDIAALGKVIQALKIIADVDAGKMPKNATYESAVKVVDFYTKQANDIAKKLGDMNAKATDDVNGQKSAWQTATEQLKDTIKTVKEASRSYTLLSKAGLSAADAFKVAKDPALAAALATTKVGTAKWKELINLVREFLAVTKTATLTDALSELSKENEMLNNFGKLSTYLQQMGLSSEEISSILGDPDLANSLLYATGEGEKGWEKIKNYIGFVQKNKNLKLSLLPLTEQFGQQMGKINEEFARKENALQVKFKVDTQSYNKVISEAEKQISALNFQADDYEAGLTRLEDGESAINEKYDNRIESLDKIISANDRIANQNKEELNIFQMVARGDIAGAAAGIAQLQQQKAKDALEARKESLEAQRKNELDSLTAEVDVNGQRIRMTRNEMEENLKNIKQQIFNIEEDRLEPAQNQVDLLQAQLDLDIEALDVVGLTKLEWEQIAVNVEEVTSKTTLYIAELEKALAIAKQIPGALAGTSKSKEGTTNPTPLVTKDDFSSNPIVPKRKTGRDGNPGSGTPDFKPGQTPGLAEEIAANPELPTIPKQAIFEKALRDYIKESNDFRSKHPAAQLLTSQAHEITLDNNWKDVQRMMKQNTAYLKYTYRENWATVGNQIGAFGNSEYWKAYRYENPTSSAHPYELLSQGIMLPGYVYADGGKVKGPGTGTSDSIPALLSNGEYVIRANAVKALGTDTLDKMNYADKNRFADGGFVDRRDAAWAARGAAQPNTKPAIASKQWWAKATSYKSAATIEAEAKAARAKLFKQGGAQGFEAGVQGMMSDFAKLEPVKAFGNFLGDKTNVASGITRGLLSALSLPVELMGSVAKTFVTGFGQASRGDLLGLAKTAFHVVTGGVIGDAVSNAISGVVNPEEQRASMFEQAAEQVIKDKTFGAGNAESDALARIIGGGLNLAGDPLSYLGVGLAARGVKTAASAAMTSAKLGDLGGAARSAGRAAALSPGVVGLPNLSDVDAIKSLLTSGKISDAKVDKATPMYTGKYTLLGTDLIPTFKIGEESTRFAFQGVGQDFSGIKAQIVKTTPEDLLKTAIKINPEDTSLQSMLNNIENKTHGAAEHEFLDNIAAAVSIDNKGKARSYEKTAGFAEILSMLTGNKKAKTLVDFKTMNLYEIIRNNLARETERRSRVTEFNNMDNLPDPATIAAIHSTPYKVAKGEDGSIYLYPNAHYESPEKGDYSRASIHFGLEGRVRDHMWGEWPVTNQTIVTSLKSLMDDNGVPYSIKDIDTWFMRNPGQPLKISDNSLITAFENPKEYEQELLRRGLLEEGQEVPWMVADPTTKEVLNLVKQNGQYTSEDRARIGQSIGRSLPEPGDLYYSNEVENKAIEDAAIQMAKKQVGINTRSYTLGQHSIESNDGRARQIMDLGVALGAENDKHRHTGLYELEIQTSPIGRASNENNNREFRTKINTDSIEALRTAVSKGKFRTYMKDTTPKPYVPEGATGGLMKNGNFVVPKYFANGGMVMPKYFANGDLARGTDVVPAMLTPGEFVMTKHAVDNYGVDNLRAINGGAAPGNSVYNGYNINVNVRSNSNPDQIANAVMTQIRQVNAQQVRGSKF